MFEFFHIEGTQESQEHSEEKHEEKISGLKFGKGLSLEQKRTIADHNEKQGQSYVKKTQLNAIGKLEIVAPEVMLEGIGANADKINIESNILKMNPMLEQQLSVILDKEEEQTLRLKITNALADTTDAVKSNKEILQAIDRANNELHEINKLHKEGKASDRALSDAQINLAVLIASEVTMALKVAKGVATLAASIGVLGFYISAEVESKVEEIVRGSSAYKFILNTLNAREIKINVINGILKGSTIDGAQEIVINVGKDLDLESVQDKKEGYAKSNSYSGEIGYSVTSVGGASVFQGNMDTHIVKVIRNLRRVHI